MMIIFDDVLAHILLTLRDKHVFVFREYESQLPTPSQ